MAGGKTLERAGYYYPPTILDCSDVPQADCVMTELFGPVLSVVSFSTEADAIQKANSTPYGLATGVFTNNLSRAHRMTKAIRSGIVWLNTYRAVSPLAPFGGHGLSDMVVKLAQMRCWTIPLLKLCGYVPQINRLMILCDALIHHNSH